MDTERLEEIALSPGHLEHMRRLCYASGIAVPLVARGRTLGVFAFVRRAGRPAYRDDDLRLAVELARRAATALDNARLFAELSATERQLEAILTTSPRRSRSRAGTSGCSTSTARRRSCSSAPRPRRSSRRRWRRSSTASSRSTRRASRSTTRGCPGATRSPAARPTRARRYISKATGLERWMLVKASPVRAEDGEVLMAVNIMEEVTDARRAEHQQRFLAAASKLLLVEPGRRRDARPRGDGDRARARGLVLHRHARRARAPAAAGHRGRPGRHAELDAIRDAFDLEGDEAGGRDARRAHAAGRAASTTRCCARGRSTTRRSRRSAPPACARRWSSRSPSATGRSAR